MTTAERIISTLRRAGRPLSHLQLAKTARDYTALLELVRDEVVIECETPPGGRLFRLADDAGGAA